ncbi:DnaJ domain-containing protein [Haloarcula sp. Atlit-7R]|uniref:DnaJ domain-containing protein n=1 Tax=Haloarcula sp. Atlit-7R TaxID=2282125 RepID=UPI001F2E9BAD|nr:DnaJ domain-containing protein [Haloarcula sp. Atlit-7R]
MEATFYGILGVDPDATEGTIVRAYREQTKTHHPDVSDDPAARDRFKRLTQAKDVLTDEAERARYDRLGHDAYVNRHVDSVADGGTATGGVSDIAQQYVDQRADAETAGETTAKATQRPTQTRGGSTGTGLPRSTTGPASGFGRHSRRESRHCSSHCDVSGRGCSSIWHCWSVRSLPPYCSQSVASLETSHRSSPVSWQPRW